MRFRFLALDAHQPPLEIAVEPRAKAHLQAGGGFDLGGNRPEVFGAGMAAFHFQQVGAAQPLAGDQQADGLEDIGFSGPVGACQHGQPCACQIEPEGLVAAEMGQVKLVQQQGHSFAFFCLL